MKLLLFDWHGDGHHGIYMERAVEALSACCALVAAGPDDVVGRLSRQPVDLLSLGDARPVPANRHHEQDLILEERALLENAVEASGADCLLHLYSDPLLAQLATGAPLEIPTAITFFYPRWHYPWTYRTLLLPRDAAKAFFLEQAIGKWRSRNDAIAVFTLDEEAVRRWNRRAGAPAFWLPEPPVPEVGQVETAERKGCILYGALAPRKGVDRLAAALARNSSTMHAVLAGSVEPGYAEELERLVAGMRAGGATVDLRAWTHHESDGLSLLARARCAVLPYHRHSGMSRVLLEAASAGTPVLVHDHGLLAALVRQYGIGRAVDCGDSRAFRKSLERLCSDGETELFRPALRAFAARYDRDRFAAALRAPFGLEAEALEPAAALEEAG